MKLVRVWKHLSSLMGASYCLKYWQFLFLYSDIFTLVGPISTHHCFVWSPFLLLYKLSNKYIVLYVLVTQLLF